jgi:hypothetical protein
MRPNDYGFVYDNDDIPEDEDVPPRTTAMFDIFWEACTAVDGDFHVLEWQADTAGKIAGCIAQGRSALLDAPMGSGKSAMAYCNAFMAVEGKTGYMAKVLIALPLVALVKEQRDYIRALCTVVNKRIGANFYRWCAMYRDQTEGDARRAQFIIGSYERVQMFLTGAHRLIYPSSRRMRKIWGEAFKLLIIDEVHMMDSDRGPVVIGMIGLVRSLGIPFIGMTGTSQASLEVDIRAAGHVLQVFKIKQPRPYRLCTCAIPDEARFMEWILWSALDSVRQTTRDNAWIIFCGTTTEIWERYCNALDYMWPKVRDGGFIDDAKLQKMDAVVHGHCIPQNLVLQRPLVPTSNPDEFDAQQRQKTWLGTLVGVAYLWRDLGPLYEKEVMKGLERGTITVVFSTSTMATGVTIPGIRHVGVTVSPSRTDPRMIHQMLGRAGRRAPGFGFFLGPKIPDITIHKISNMTEGWKDLIYWLIIQLSKSAPLSDHDNAYRSTLSRQQWRTFLDGFPIPIAIRENIDTVLRGVMDTLIKRTGLAYVKKDETIELKMNYSEIAMISATPGYAMSSRVAVQVGKWEMDIKKDVWTCVIPCLLYWLSRGKNLPYLVGRDDSAMVEFLGPLYRATKWPLSYDLVQRYVSAYMVQISAMAVDNPFTDRQIPRLAMLTLGLSLTLCGHAVRWKKFFPRLDIVRVLWELPPFVDIYEGIVERAYHADAVQFNLKFTRDVVYSAAAMVSDKYPNYQKRVVLDAVIPLSAAWTITMNAPDQPTPEQLIGFLYPDREQAAQVVAKLVGRPEASCLFTGCQWRRSIVGTRLEKYEVLRERDVVFEDA